MKSFVRGFSDKGIREDFLRDLTGFDRFFEGLYTMMEEAQGLL